jgi:hypothetical protein
MTKHAVEQLVDWLDSKSWRERRIKNLEINY